MFSRKEANEKFEAGKRMASLLQRRREAIRQLEEIKSLIIWEPVLNELDRRYWLLRSEIEAIFGIKTRAAKSRIQRAIVKGIIEVELHRPGRLAYYKKGPKA